MLETLLKEHEMILDMYITQMKFANLDLAFENYSKIYQKLHHTYGDVAPFSTYYHLIDKYRKTNLQDKSLQLIQFTFNAFKAEHQQKLSATEKKFLDSDFEDVQIMKDNLSLLDTLIKQA
ncbi:MAG: hypothetical protein LBD75_00920 [Candidatus Peribacteria bacterium]|nr:hypothetical protein [Candidatus Peribacteria bacterium]